MREQSSAFKRFGIAIIRGWRDFQRAQELMLQRPWEEEGDLRWVTDAGGPRLVGAGVPSSRARKRVVA